MKREWQLQADELARKFSVEDIDGVLAKKLSVPGGQRLLVMSRGRSEVVSEGDYTLKSLPETLRFWRPKQCTCVLVQANAQTQELDLQRVVSKDGRVVDLTLRVTWQIDDLRAFHENMMGVRELVDLPAMRTWLRPSIESAAWDAVGRLTFDELTTSGHRERLEAFLEKALTPLFATLGLRLSLVLSAPLENANLDADRDRAEAQRGQESALDAARAQQNLNHENQRLDLQDELESLKVRNHRLDGLVQARIERLDLFNQLRNASIATKSDQADRDEKLAECVGRVARAQIVQAHEQQQLEELLQRKRQGDQAAGEQLAAMAELQHKAELARLHYDIREELAERKHAQQLKLAQLTESHSNAQWREELKKSEEEFLAKRAQRRQVWQEELDGKVRQRREAIALMREQSVAQNEAESRKLDLEEKRRQAQLDSVERMLQASLQADEKQADLQISLEQAKADCKSQLVRDVKSLDPKLAVGFLDGEGGDRVVDVLNHEQSEQTKRAQAEYESRSNAAHQQEMLAAKEEQIQAERAHTAARADDQKHTLATMESIVREGYRAMSSHPPAPSNSPLLLQKCSACGAMHSLQATTCACGNQLS